MRAGTRAGDEIGELRPDAQVRLLRVLQEKDREGFEKIAATALKNAAAFGVTGQMLQGTTISVPTISFTQAARVDLGGIAVELIAAAPSHSPGSAFVWVPSRKAVFAGDLLFTDFHPYMADGEVAGWVKALDVIVALDVVAIVPGHGPLSTKKDLTEMQASTATFDAARLVSRKAQS